MSQHQEAPSYAEHLAGIVSGTATTKTVSAMKVVSYRVPVYFLAAVDAMAKKSKKSRNSMLNLLLQVGIDEVRKHLSDEVATDLLMGESDALQQLLDGSLESVEE